MKLRPGIGRNFHQFIDHFVVLIIFICEELSAELEGIVCHLPLFRNSFEQDSLHSFPMGGIYADKVIIEEQDEYSFHSLHLFRIVGKIHASFRGAIVVEDSVAQLFKVAIFILRLAEPACKQPIRTDFVGNNHDLFTVVVHLACERLCNLNHLATAFLFSLGTISLYHIGIECQL